MKVSLTGEALVRAHAALAIHHPWAFGFTVATFIGTTVGTIDVLTLFIFSLTW